MSRRICSNSLLTISLTFKAILTGLQHRHKPLLYYLAEISSIWVDVSQKHTFVQAGTPGSISQEYRSSHPTRQPSSQTRIAWDSAILLIRSCTLDRWHTDAHSHHWSRNWRLVFSARMRFLADQSHRARSNTGIVGSNHTQGMNGWVLVSTKAVSLLWASMIHYTIFRSLILFVPAAVHLWRLQFTQQMEQCNLLNPSGEELWELFITMSSKCQRHNVLLAISCGEWCHAGVVLGPPDCPTDRHHSQTTIMFHVLDHVNTGDF
jgi:hypothetical protein